MKLRRSGSVDAGPRLPRALVHYEDGTGAAQFAAAHLWLNSQSSANPMRPKGLWARLPDCHHFFAVLAFRHFFHGLDLPPA